ncbi:MAG: hypothetical protein VX265_00990 [Myxococcota bacterium]|nr:hypothetical protein [Myxococcota bacterium]MEC8424756.1 hypothetical protein [Myxococcota bacterium]
MPEGDAIRAVATVLGRKLIGRALVHGRILGRAPRVLDGAAVGEVRPIGKHLLLRIDGPAPALGIRTHLGMEGSWHRYTPGPRWRRPGSRTRIILETASDVMVCRAPAQLEVGSWKAVMAGRSLAALGPDILDRPCPAAAAAARAVAYAGQRTVLEVLLDQRVACGIGNIAAHEALFEIRLHPHTPAAHLDTASWVRLYKANAALLHGRVALGGRGATVRPRVYGRGRKSCPRCRHRIVAVPRGHHGRPSAWCPTCQPMPA